jgi:DNA-binding MarR family transcriptional regulator
MQQIELPLSRRTDPITSYQAARRIGLHVDSHEWAILQALESGPMTAKELARATKLTDVQVSRRGAAMCRQSLITIGPDQRDGCRIWRHA